MTVSLTASGIGYRVAAATLLHPTDLAVEPGRLVAIVGPNGAGKTTLLRLLGGDLEPSTGSVAFDGRAVTEFDGAELALVRSLLTQGGPGGIPFRVADVVALGRTPHHHRMGNSSDEDRRAVHEAIDSVGIDHLVDRIEATLSSGERALAAVARILAQDTPILLLDEPTTALDVAHEERVMGLLRRLAATGRTVVTVVHQLDLAARHADRVIAVSQGRVVADGAPQSVLTGELLTTIYRHPMSVVPHPSGRGLLVLVDPIDDGSRPDRDD